MKAGILVLVLAVAAVAGYELGWFKFSSSSDDKKENVTLSVDKDKIQGDKDKAVNKVQDMGQQAKDKTEATTKKTQN